MPKCAFLSIANTEGWFIDDDLVHRPLQDLGWEVENVPWDRPEDWDSYDLVIIRSPWDYQDHLDRFREVLKSIGRSRAVLLNGLETVLWNIDKKYLFELEKKGVELVPTIITRGLKESDIEAAFSSFQTEELVIKPVIGANADDTFRLRQGEPAGFPPIAEVFRARECFIQPFMPQILDEGEYSLMYFKGELSHAILKTARKGDYRVQEEHGGGVLPIPKPDALLVASGDRAMRALPVTPFYARVDLVRTARDSFALMELELIEPCLYFRFDEASPQRFADCIDQYWKSMGHAGKDP